MDRRKPVGHGPFFGSQRGAAPRRDVPLAFTASATIRELEPTMSDDQIRGALSRRSFLGATTTVLGALATASTRVSAVQPPATTTPGKTVEEADIGELQRRLAAGEASSRSLVEEYLHRIE